MDEIENLSNSICSTFISWLYLRTGSWDTVARCFGVNRGIVWRMVHDENYEPQDPRIRKQFGMRRYAPVPVCPIHGKPHTHNCQPGREMVELPPMAERRYLLAEIWKELVK